MVFKIIGCCLVFLHILAVYPQEYGYNVEKIDGSSGFTGNGVLSIAQDESGTIWFGTVNALFEYDGYKFKRHQQIRNKNSLIGRFVKGLAADQAGNLWITVFPDFGLQQLDLASRNFNQYTHNENNANSISSNHGTDVYIDSEKNLWVFGLESLGLNKVIVSKYPQKKDSVSFVRYPIDKQSEYGLSAGKIWSVADDGKGHLWIGTVDGLNKLNIASGKITKYYHDTKDPQSLMYNVINKLYFDSDGVLWIGSDKGLSYVENPQSENLKFTHFTDDPKNPTPLFNDNDKIPRSEALPIGENRNDGALPGPIVLDIIELEPGKILVGTFAAGLAIYDKNAKHFSNEINNLVAEKYNISEWTPERIFIDRDGVIWIASGLKHGVIKMTRDRFKLLRKSFNASEQIGKSEILGMTATDNIIWVGLVDGLERFDLKKGSVEQYDFSDKGDLVLNTDRNGTLWIGSGKGVYYFDETKKQIIPYELPIYEVHDEARSTSGILHDSQGNYWMSTWLCGISRVSPSNGQVQHYYLEGSGCAYDDNRINVTISMHESKDGKIWAGTFKGIYVFEPEKDVFKKVATYRDCGAIIDGPGNSILFASEDNIQKLDLNDYSNIEDFIGNTELTDQFHVNNFVLDRKGHLWVNTPQAGLWVYEPETNRVQKFSLKQGLQGYNSGFHCMVKNSIGEIITSGTSDVNIFDPEVVRANNDKPQVSILNIATSSTNEAWDGLNLNAYFLKDQPIALPNEVHSFRITFGVMDYHAQELNRYEYQLGNFEEKWSETSGLENNATYTNLDKGSYVFKVRGANSYGVWNEKGTELSIIILPAPWETWWAYCLYMISVLAIGYAIQSFRIKRIQLKSKLLSEQQEAIRLTELDELKSNFFANISHEFRTPLTLILAYAKKLEGDERKSYQEGDLKVIKRNAHRVLHLVNQLLDLSKIESGKLDLNIKTYSLNLMIRNICAQFNTLAEMKTLGFQVYCEDEIQGNFDLEKMEMVLNNMISNAIKFTPAGGKVWVEVKLGDGGLAQNDGKVEINIGDTGSGIAENEQQRIFDRFYQVNSSSTRVFQGTGIGLAVSKEIVRLHGGEIKIESRLGQGSIFKISLPQARPDQGNSRVMPLPDGINTYHSMMDLDLIQDSADIAASNGRENPILLIVEDSADLRAFLKQNLSENYQIVLAENGLTGYNKAISLIPDLIISDLMMPILDGRALCEKIKGNIRTSHIPFIMLTAKFDTPTRIESLEFGADDYMIKPFDIKVIAARIRNLIASRINLYEIYSQQIYFEPLDSKTPSLEEVFLAKINHALQENFKDPHFSVQNLAQLVSLSEVQLLRKLKALTNQTPNEIVREYRLKFALNQLKKRTGNISEIAYDSGFNSASYFSKCFKDKYGCAPKEYFSNS